MGEHSLQHRPTAYEVSVLCDTEAATSDVAATLAPFLKVGDAILLKGGLAVGKTFFVQALVRALGSADEVTSPTFALAHFYRITVGTFLHADAYRLSSVAEYRDLGLDEYADHVITAVEWGEKVEEEFPDPLSIVLAFAGADGASRTITFSSASDRWGPLMQELNKRLGKRGG
jgi:tRNA threonylcarbamoyladenosine biosynthesis protein TsaE